MNTYMRPKTSMARVMVYSLLVVVAILAITEVAQTGSGLIITGHPI